MPTRAVFFATYSELFEPMFNNLDIELGEYGYFRGDPSWNVVEGPRYFNRLYFVVDGYGLVKQEGKVTELLPGNLYLLPSHQQYHLICPQRIEKFYIHFNINLCQVQDLFLSCQDILRLPWAKKMEPPFSEMENITNIYELLPYHNFIYNTIFEFLQFVPEELLNQYFWHGLKYQKAFHYIQENLRVSLTIEEISRHSNYSVYMLAKKFKKDLGFSLNEYVQNKLLDYAIHQLYTFKNIKEIAEEMDFCDVHYFSNWFKRKTGYTPSQYRNEVTDQHELYFYKNRKPFRNSLEQLLQNKDA